jgi:ribosomal protein L30/L7E
MRGQIGVKRGQATTLRYQMRGQIGVKRGQTTTLRYQMRGQIGVKRGQTTIKNIKREDLGEKMTMLFSRTMNFFN